MKEMMANYGWGLPVAASTYAGKIDQSLLILHIAMFAIFVPWAIFMAYCLLRYRSSKGAKAVYSHEMSLKSYIPDVLIFVFEVWLIFFVGVPIWAHIREELPKPESATVVQVVAEQFNWTFHYAGPDGKFGATLPALVSSDNPLGIDPNNADGKDDFISINELYAPMGKPILLYLTSKDVVHSFFVPEFRTKQDVVPGMRIPLWVEPSMTGRFEIGCAQLCGAGHYRMRGDVFVKTPEEYEAWAASKIKL